MKNSKKEMESVADKLGVSKDAKFVAFDPKKMVDENGKVTVFDELAGGGDVVLMVDSIV